MQKNFLPVKGFRDFLPKEAKKRQWLKNQMIAVFERWGFEPLETPTLEPLELFEGKIGEEEKLFYKFQDQGDRWLALRYDQTVPTCRVVGQYFDQITFPFRRYQIQPNFRAEKPQKGRYREFTQADIDIFGIKSTTADAECIAVSLDLYKTLGFKQAIAVINNRDLLSEIPYSALASIDKLKKIGKDGVIQDMVAKSIPQEKAEQYLKTTTTIAPDKSIDLIFDFLKNLGFSSDSYLFDPTLVRSFSYSQGPIWEIIIPEYSAGSVGGGERYDGLVKRITGKDIAGTGIAFGIDRTLEALEICNLLPDIGSVAKILVTVFSSDLSINSAKLAQKIRSANINAELYPDFETKLDKQLKYADRRGIRFVTIIGPEEAKNDTITVKDLTSRTQETVSFEGLLAKLAQ